MSITTRPAGVRVRVTYRGEVIADTRDAIVAFYADKVDSITLA